VKSTTSSNSDLIKIDDFMEKIEKKLEDKFKKRLDEKDKLIHELKEKQTKKLEEDVKYFKNITNHAGLIVEKSVSTINYLINNYDKALAIEQLPEPDYELIKKGKSKNSDLATTVIHYYKMKELPQLFGEFVVETYKKDNPLEQSVFNSDEPRLSFVLRQIVNNEPTWVTDKRGLKTGKFLVDPLLQYIKNDLNKNIKIYGKKMKDKSISSETMEHYWREMTYASEIVRSIDNQTLKADIMKFIAPHFYLIKIKNKIK
jgi:hypothetical protein